MFLRSAVMSLVGLDNILILCRPTCHGTPRYHSYSHIENIQVLNPDPHIAYGFSSAGLSHPLPARRAAWQREGEPAQDEGGYHGPTCPPHRRPNAFLFALPSLSFRIPQIRIYARTHTPSSIQPYAPAQPCGAMHPRCALWHSHFLTDQSLGLYWSSPP